MPFLVTGDGSSDIGFHGSFRARVVVHGLALKLAWRCFGVLELVLTGCGFMIMSSRLGWWCFTFMSSRLMG